MPRERNDRAESPVGGAVVFAASALLATAGAGAFLALSHDVRETAQGTGVQSMAMARTSLEVRGMVGKILGGGTALDALNLTLALGPGADPAGLAHVVVEVRNRTTLRLLAWGTAGGLGQFTTEAVRDADGSIAAHGVVNHDDLVGVHLNVSAAANDVLFPPREPLRLAVRPEPGAPLAVELTTPPTYAGRTIVPLR